jgi:hypothetical protein
VRADAQGFVGCFGRRLGRGFQGLSSTDERDDLNPVPIPQLLFGVAAAGDNLLVQFHGNAAKRHFQTREQLGHRQLRRLFTPLAIEEDVHEAILPLLYLHL